MKKYLVLVLLSLFLLNCTEKEAEIDQTDPILLKKDQEKLDEIITGFDVLIYKFIKISMRASILGEETTAVSATQNKLDKVSYYIHQYEVDSLDLHIWDYISIYKDFTEIIDFITEADEDDYPTLLEVSDRLSLDEAVRNKPLSTGEEKRIKQSGEHAIFSLFMLTGSGFTSNMILYECSKTYPELHPDGEAKSLFMIFRGYIFFTNQLYYLAENEMTQNIQWLQQNPNVELPILDFIFYWNDMSHKEKHKTYASLNYLFRGFSRLMMEDEASQKKGLDDFAIFIESTKETGMDNELVWAIEAYTYIKNEESEKAIIALNRLKKSDLMGANERSTINESIEFLEKRENETVLNSVYDKVFLGKIATDYILYALVGSDWQQVLKNNNIPNTDEIFSKFETFTEFTINLTKYGNTEYLEEYEEMLLEESNQLLEDGTDVLKDAEKAIENVATDLWNDAQDLFE